MYRLRRYSEALNQLDKAISQSSVLDRALQISSIKAINYRDRAEGYLLINKLIEAERDLYDACSIDDQDPEIYFLYALLFYKRGDSDNEKKYMQKAKMLGYIEQL